MQIRVAFTFFKHALAVFSLAVILTACGGGDSGGGGGGGGGVKEHAPELFGSWDLIEIEVLMMDARCPAEIGIGGGSTISCGTTVVTFNGDGTYVSVDTTDELGVPFNERTEGTWSTEGNILTITEMEEGPDENNLEPIDPTEPLSLTWSVSANESLTVIEDDTLPAAVTLRLEKVGDGEI